MRNLLFACSLFAILLSGCIGRNRCDCNFEPAISEVKIRVENSEGENLLAGSSRTFHYNNIFLNYTFAGSGAFFNAEIMPVGSDTSGISFQAPNATFYYLNYSFDASTDTIGVYLIGQDISCCEARKIHRIDINGVETKPNQSGFYVVKK